MSSDLRDEFERLKPHLREEARKPTSDGAYARAMLIIMPHVILWLEKEKKADTLPQQVIEGAANFLPNVLLHVLRATIEAGAQPKALEVVLRHIETSLKPMVGKTAGGIIVPGGVSKQ